MADLTGRAFERGETQVSKTKAPQKGFRDPNELAGHKDLSEAAAWDAVGQASQLGAKIFKGWDDNRQQAIIADMETNITTKFAEDHVFIDNDLQYMDATNLDPKSFL